MSIQELAENLSALISGYFSDGLCGICNRSYCSGISVYTEAFYKGNVGGSHKGIGAQMRKNVLKGRMENENRF